MTLCKVSSKQDRLSVSEHVTFQRLNCASLLEFAAFEDQRHESCEMAFMEQYNWEMNRQNTNNCCLWVQATNEHSSFWSNECNYFSWLIITELAMIVHYEALRRPNSIRKKKYLELSAAVMMDFGRPTQTLLSPWFPWQNPNRIFPLDFGFL